MAGRSEFMLLSRGSSAGRSVWGIGSTPGSLGHLPGIAIARLFGGMVRLSGVRSGGLHVLSMMGADYQPYWCRRGDVPHRDRAYQWGKEVELVEFPVSWTLDDFPQMEFVINPALSGLSGYDKTLEMWRTDFNYMLEEEPDGVFCITFHPQVIGRGGRMTILQDLIGHMKAADATFRRVADVVADWKAAHPLPTAAG